MAYSVLMKPEPLGKLITTPGTLIRITANLANATDGAKAAGNTNSRDDLWFNKLEIKAASANTGAIYIGKSTMVRATLVDVIRVIDPGESWSLTDPTLRDTYHAGDFYFDSDNAPDYAHGSLDVV